MTPRDLVTRRIVSRANSYPNFDLEPLDTSGLDGRDVALARAIDHAVARHWIMLATVLNSRLDQQWEDLQPSVQAPLLVGAAQLLAMQRLPDHAIIHEAVEWTKHNARRKAGGLVNAVLRKVARLRQGEVPASLQGGDLPQDQIPLEQGGALRLSEDVFDVDPNRRLAQQTSHNEEMIRAWLQFHGADVTRQLALHSLVNAPIVVTGVPADASPQLCPHRIHGFSVFTGSRAELEGLLSEHPAARVQDAGTAEAMMLSSHLRPKLIIDLCAGRGTKTRQLAELHPDATIIATDIDAGRFELLQKSFSGHSRVRTVPFTDVHQYREQANLLVLDVPCSNTGVLARRVEAKYRFSVETLVAVRDLQRQIVADALPLLSPDGFLLYSTCSIEPVENQQQAEWITQWHPFDIVSSTKHLPSGQPSDDPTVYTDGGYAALLRRT